MTKIYISVVFLVVTYFMLLSGLAYAEWKGQHVTGKEFGQKWPFAEAERKKYAEKPRPKPVAKKQWTDNELTLLFVLTAAKNGIDIDDLEIKDNFNLPPIKQGERFLAFTTQTGDPEGFLANMGFMAGQFYTANKEMGARLKYLVAFKVEGSQMKMITVSSGDINLFIEKKISAAEFLLSWSIKEI